MKTVTRHLTLALALLLAGCGTVLADDASRLEQMGSHLILVLPAVEEEICGDPASANLPESALVSLTRKRLGNRLDAFAGHVLRVRCQQGLATMLVCSPDGSRALLQDAGCSLRLDEKTWKQRPDSPCEFTLDLATICPKPQ